MRLRLAAGAAIVALGCLVPAPSRADEAPATSPAGSPAPAPSKRTVWPWILMGTGVGLIVTATVLEVNAVGEDDTRKSEEVKLTSYAALPASDTDKKKALQASVDDHSKSASSDRTAALIIGTVGFLAVAGSVVLWFFEGSASTPPPPATLSSRKLNPSLMPAFGPSYVGTTLGASF